MVDCDRFPLRIAIAFPLPPRFPPRPLPDCDRLSPPSPLPSPPVAGLRSPFPSLPASLPARCRIAIASRSGLRSLFSSLPASLPARCRIAIASRSGLRSLSSPTPPPPPLRCRIAIASRSGLRSLSPPHPPSVAGLRSLPVPDCDRFPFRIAIAFSPTPPLRCRIAIAFSPTPPPLPDCDRPPLPDCDRPRPRCRIAIAPKAARMRKRVKKNRQNARKC